MKYDFDQIIDRRGTHSVKYDAVETHWGRTDLIPMWVADMDFATAPFVTEAVQQRCEQGLFGYTLPHEGYYQAIVQWNRDRYGWAIQKEQLQFVPGIVPGLAIAVNSLTAVGDRILIQPPVYHPFAWVVERNGRQLVKNPLKWVDGRLRMDMEDFRRKVKGCKVFILCNPHNPGGLVWTEEELREVARICAEESVVVFSDEIHADLTLPPHRHHPFASVCEEARQNSVTFMSPSKAFNMPGFAASHALIFNPSLRERFHRYMEACELGMGHVFAFIAVEAAYSQGTEWLSQCLTYIQGNVDYVDEFLKEHAPRIKAIRPEASFLVWLDCRELGLTQPQLVDFFVDQAHLALNDGAMFGQEGVGFMRLNVGAPRATIEKAMTQLAEAYRSLSV